MTGNSDFFFDSFRIAVESAYEAFLEHTGDEQGKENTRQEDSLDRYLEASYQEWLCQPMEELSGKLPAEYLDSVEDFEELMGMFRRGAVVCDDGLPDLFLQKLRKQGNAVDALLKLASQGGDPLNDDTFLAPLMAVKVLGQWNEAGASKPLIDLLDSDGVPDLMFETVRDALVSIGIPALEYIIGTLDSGNATIKTKEYLLIALADIGRKNKSDSVYQELKKAFLELPEKLVAAACLGDYGDGRAVQLLRGYLTKNDGALDRETFYEIVSAIRKLGGRIDDLKQGPNNTNCL